MRNKPIKDILYDLFNCYPSIKDFMRDFPPFEVKHENCSVKHVPILADASDGGLEN
jgi:hypothetical protein